MAMQISKDTPFGVPATYWRIAAGTIDYARGTLDITVMGYKDQAAREAGAEPLGRWHRQWSGDAFAAVAEPTRAAIYAALLADAYWDGAVEV